MKIRQSNIALFHRCPHGFKMAIDGIEGIPTEAMIYGTEQHNKIYKSLVQGIVPDNIKPFFDDMGFHVDFIETEQVYTAKYKDIDITCTLDLTMGDIIVDYKFITTEFNVNNYYDTIQSKIYSWVYLQNFPRLEEVKFSYWFPEYNKRTDVMTYERRLSIDEIMYPIIQTIGFGIFEPVRNSQCNTCIYAHACKYMDIELLKTEIVPYEKKFELTMANAIDVFEFIDRADAVIKEARRRLKAFVKENGEVVGDDKILYLKESAGRKVLKKDDSGKKLTYKKIVESLGGNYEDYTEQGYPSFNLSTRSVE